MLPAQIDPSERRLQDEREPQLLVRAAALLRLLLLSRAPVLCALQLELRRADRDSDQDAHHQADAEVPVDMGIVLASVVRQRDAP